MHGPHAEKMKEHNSKSKHMGFEENYEYHPHISVPKAVHDDIKAKGHKTAHEAGIEFGHAVLRHGDKVLHTYKPKEVKKSDEKVETGEKFEPLKKPYVSEAQRRWAHTESGKEALGGEAGVHEWDKATKGKKLPEKVKKSEELSKAEKANRLSGDYLRRFLEDNPEVEKLLKKEK
jgi:hypothetical protein